MSQATSQQNSTLKMPTDPSWLAGLMRDGYMPVLKRLVRGQESEDLEEALELVVRTIEAQVEGVVGSILLLDEATNQLRHGAGSNLPQVYRDAIDGIVIGPEVGSCGAAAWKKSRVIVEDISTDGKWAAYRELALGCDLRACWSQPIMDGERVLGTFAMYYKEPRRPTEDDLQVIDAAALFARLAIERYKARVLAADQDKLKHRLWEAQKKESLAALAGGVAHDFNNLLVGIIGSADLAEHQIPASSPAVDDLHRIQTTAVRCSELCKQLLAYAGKGKLIVQAFQLPELVREMGHLLEVSLSKNIAVRYQFADCLPAIEGDPSQVRQVVLNLMTNAAEALSGEIGAITIGLGLIEVSASPSQETFSGGRLEPGSYVALEVSDTGCGMDADTILRIFDPFFSTKFTGRGLGLAAVLGIMRGHGGALRVYSEPGKGTTFKLLFPTSSEHAADHSGSPPAQQDFTGRGTVLVVDDEELVREVAKRLLETQGFTVLTAKDGREALAVYAEYRDQICVVLLDMVMPNLDGEGTYRELLKINPLVSVVLSSGYNEVDITAQFMNKGVRGFVQKPYRQAELLSTLGQAIAGVASPTPSRPSE